MKLQIKACPFGHMTLSDELRSILKNGLTYDNGCLLFQSQVPANQPNLREHFQDETGYECFVNHLHLEDLISTRDVCFLLQQALLFAEELDLAASKYNVAKPLEYIISSNDDEVNVRFHILRPSQNWLTENLEQYEEAVAAVQLNQSGPNLMQRIIDELH